MVEKNEVFSNKYKRIYQDIVHIEKTICEKLFYSYKMLVE